MPRASAILAPAYLDRRRTCFGSHLLPPRHSSRTAKPGSGLAQIVETAFYPASGLCIQPSCFKPSWTRDALNRQTDYTWSSSHGQLLTGLEPADANGQRRKTINEHDRAGRLLRERICLANGAGVELTCGTAAEQVKAFTYRRALLADHQGSVVSVGDMYGNPVAINRYDEWGNPAAGNVGRFQYTGQAWLSELGMYYYKARIYTPTLGRFLQTDPVGYDDQINLYAYVGNDPVNRNDPLGLKTIDCSGGVGKGDCISGTQVGKGDVIIAKVDGKTVSVNVSGKGIGSISTSLDRTGSRIVSNKQVGNIVFNEARSFSGPRMSSVHQTIAGSVMNADQTYGGQRGRRVGTASSDLDERRLVPPERIKLAEIRRDVVATAALRSIGWDVARGATHIFFSGSPNSVHPGLRRSPMFSIGPFSNSFTFGDTPCRVCYAGFYDTE